MRGLRADLLTQYRFEVVLRRKDGEVSVDGGTFKLSVPSDKREPLGNYMGKKVILGIRPNDIYDCQFAPPLRSPCTMKAVVDAMEPMGDQVYLHLTTGDKVFNARVDPRTEARIGQEMEVLINMDNMHFFDPQTEKAVR